MTKPVVFRIGKIIIQKSKLELKILEMIKLKSLKKK